MSFQNLTSPEKNKMEGELFIASDVLEKETAKVFKKNVGKIAIPGFRKGKAPRSIIEKMYGKGVFEEEAIDNLLPAMYEEAVKEAELTVVSRPEVDVASRDESGITFKFAFYIKPEVVVKDYLGIKVKKEEVSVTEEDVENELKAVQNRNGRTLTAEDEAKDGDTVVIDYEGSVDGVPFEGGAGEGHNLTLGSGSFIPGFEDQLIGKKAGEETDVNVTFPEDYHAADLAGKAAVFKVKLHEVKRVELPELDDEFAKDVSEFETLDEYKADIKAKIQSRKERDAEATADSALYDAVVENTEVDLPECMIESEVDSLFNEYEQNMRYQGIDIDMYLKYTGTTIEAMREQLRPRAEKALKTRLALEYIAKAENVAVVDEDYEDEYKKIAESYNMELDKVKESLPKDSLTEGLKLQNAFKAVKAASVAE